jgi:2-oxoglutarate ferredoxin oxidoreductase subunit delta
MSRKKQRKSATDSDASTDQVQPRNDEAESVQGSRRKRQFEIDIFEGWCKSCGICAAFCPRQCIELDEDGAPVVKAGERCTGCGWCEIHCPDFAISVRPKQVGRSDEGD